MANVIVHVQRNHTMPRMRVFEVALRQRNWRYQLGKKVYDPNPELSGISVQVKSLLERTFGLTIVDIHANGNKLAITIGQSDIWHALVEKAVAEEIGYYVAQSQDYEVVRK